MQEYIALNYKEYREKIEQFIYILCPCFDASL